MQSGGHHPSPGFVVCRGQRRRGNKPWTSYFRGHTLQKTTALCHLGQTISHLALLVTCSCRAGTTLPCLPDTLWRQTRWDLCLERCSQDKTTQVHATTLQEELQQRSRTDEMELANYLSPRHIVPHKQIWKIAERSTVVAYSGGKRGLGFLLRAFSLLTFTRTKSIIEKEVERGSEKKRKLKTQPF